MPMYMDIHELPGVTLDDVAKAHVMDQHVQAPHGVEYIKYWVNQKQGKVFCLCHAPDAKAADAVHREAHGLAAARIMEVTPEIADAFMGAAEVDGAGAVLLPGNTEHDSGTRTILFTDIRLRFDLDTDAPADKLDTLLKLTERYCVVFQTLNNKPELSATLTRK